MITISAVDLAALNAGQPVSLQSAQSPPIPGTLVSPVFENGKFYWAGDFDFSLKAVYGQIITCTLTGAWGGWLPFAPGFGSPNWPGFSLAPYTKWHAKVRPHLPNWKGALYYVEVGDKPVGNGVDLTKCGTFTPGQWTTLDVPLADNAVTGLSILKFGLQDKTGVNIGGFDVDECGFL